ncbi:MAG: hypothetical protein EOM22_17685 [Gammaproteobacteria bacterium]|nr:hypothetical protein [Gammaproteobacteria bacterium]
MIRWPNYGDRSVLRAHRAYVLAARCGMSLAAEVRASLGHRRSRLRSAQYNMWKRDVIAFPQSGLRIYR